MTNLRTPLMIAMVLVLVGLTQPANANVLVGPGVNNGDFAGGSMD